MNAYERLIEWLESCEYQEVDASTSPNELGHLEYMVGMAMNKRMVTLGSGTSGDGEAFVIFYFTLDSGDFLNHGVFDESEDD